LFAGRTAEGAQSRETPRQWQFRGRVRASARRLTTTKHRQSRLIGATEALAVEHHAPVAAHRHAPDRKLRLEERRPRRQKSADIRIEVESEGLRKDLGRGTEIGRCDRPTCDIDTRPEGNIRSRLMESDVPADRRVDDDGLRRRRAPPRRGKQDPGRDKAGDRSPASRHDPDPRMRGQFGIFSSIPLM